MQGDVILANLPTSKPRAVVLKATYLTGRCAAGAERDKSHGQ